MEKYEGTLNIRFLVFQRTTKLLKISLHVQTLCTPELLLCSEIQFRLLRKSLLFHYYCFPFFNPPFFFLLSFIFKINFHFVYLIIQRINFANNEKKYSSNISCYYTFGITPDHPLRMLLPGANLDLLIPIWVSSKFFSSLYCLL